MVIKIAAGNPIVKTGSANQFVGNWPGVTVEKKGRPPQEGEKDVIITDLPGIYSLSPYTMEGSRRPQRADRPAPGRAAQHHRRNQSERNRI